MALYGIFSVCFLYSASVMFILVCKVMCSLVDRYPYSGVSRYVFMSFCIVLGNLFFIFFATRNIGLAVTLILVLDFMSVTEAVVEARTYMVVLLLL